MGEQLVGAVTHYYGKARVAGIEVTGGELHVGDTIHVVGHTSDFSQTVESMQIEHDDVGSAKPGNRIGIKIIDRVREHDKVYVVQPD